MKTCNLWLFLVFLSFNSFTFGNEGEQDVVPVLYMEDLVVTASRFGQSLSDLSPSVSVFSKKTIEDGLYLNVTDVLNQIPGLHLSANGGMGKVTSMFTRGSESNHTAVLLNGRRLPTGFSGQYDLGQLSLSNVGTIEVVRGDNSSLYGGAIGGVVNVRSNVAKGGQNQKLKAEVGSDNGKFYDYNYSLVNDRLNSSFGISSANTDGYQENSAFERNSANLYFVYALNDSIDLDFQYLYYDTILGVRGSIYNQFNPGEIKSASDEINKTKAYMYSPGLTFHISDTSNIKVTTNMSKNELKAIKTDYSSDNIFTENINCLESTYEFSHSDNKVKSILGLMFEKRKYEQNPINNFSTSSVSDFEVSYDTRSFFTNTIYQIDRLSEIEVGGRIDSFSNNFERSRSGSIKYSKILGNDEKTKIHAKYSYGKNPPDLLILAYGQNYNFFLEDIDIELEAIRSKEIGIKTNLGEHELGFVYFDNFINNLSTAPWSPNGYQRVLVDSSQTGSETYLSGKLGDQIRYNISYSYLNAKDDEGSQLIRRPKHKWKASIAREFSNFNIGANFTKVSGLTDFAGKSFDIKDYSVARIYGTYFVSEVCSIHFRVENAMNEKYSYLKGYPAPPRQAYLGMTYGF
jgi:vitamin B12 transporter